MTSPLAHLSRLADSLGVQWPHCTLCLHWHPLEHCTGKAHHRTVWQLKQDLIQRGLGYDEGRQWFWEVISARGGLQLRFNHLDATVEIWKPTSETPQLGRFVQLPSQLWGPQQLWGSGRPSH